jgi:hypothetical protein
MRVRHLALIGSLAALAGCGGPSLETRTFEFRYLDGGTAERIVRPYVYTDRPKSPGVFSSTAQTISVRETRDNLERIARVLAEQDRPPANVRLVFTIIEADGAGPVDSSIAPIEAQLRRLFRFRGYRALAQTVTVASERTSFSQILGEGRGRYMIRGELETVNVRGDSGVVRVQVALDAPGRGAALNTRISIALGQTVVLGGQPGAGAGALILAVRPELAAP